MIIVRDVVLPVGVQRTATSSPDHGMALLEFGTLLVAHARVHWKAMRTQCVCWGYRMETLLLAPLVDRCACSVIPWEYIAFPVYTHLLMFCYLLQYLRYCVPGFLFK